MLLAVRLDARHGWKGANMEAGVCHETARQSHLVAVRSTLQHWKFRQIQDTLKHTKIPQSILWFTTRLRQQDQRPVFDAPEPRAEVSCLGLGRVNGR